MWWCGSPFSSISLSHQNVRIWSICAYVPRVQPTGVGILTVVSHVGSGARSTLLNHYIAGSDLKVSKFHMHSKRSSKRSQKRHFGKLCLSFFLFFFGFNSIFLRFFFKSPHMYSSSEMSIDMLFDILRRCTFQVLSLVIFPKLHSEVSGK